MIYASRRALCNFKRWAEDPSSSVRRVDPSCQPTNDIPIRPNRPFLNNVRHCVLADNSPASYHYETTVGGALPVISTVQVTTSKTQAYILYQIDLKADQLLQESGSPLACVRVQSRNPHT